MYFWIRSTLGRLYRWMLPDSRPFKQHKNWLISGISFMMICRVFSCKHRERTYHNQDLIWGGYRADGISCCLIKHMTFLIDVFLCWLFNTAWQIFGKVSKMFFFFILNEGGSINTMMSNKQKKKKHHNGPIVRAWKNRHSHSVLCYLQWKPLRNLDCCHCFLTYCCQCDTL